MIPNIFISSTIADLHYMRDAVRDVIADLGLRPVMSEHGEVAYLFDSTAEASCYATLQQCQVAVVIIGKRYGSLGKDKLSVTHNEYRTAVERRIPIFCLVDREVLAFKRVFDVNPKGDSLSFPGMENAASVFSFVHEVDSAPKNNAILDFDSVPSARFHLRQQFALLFGDLLARHADPVKADVRDILSEVKALRHKLAPETGRLVRAIRMLLDDDFRSYGSLIEQFGKPIEDSIPAIIDADSFAAAVKAATGSPIVEFQLTAEGAVPDDRLIGGGEELRFKATTAMRTDKGEEIVAVLAVTDSGKVFATPGAIQRYNGYHKRLLAGLDSQEPLSLRLSPKVDKRRSSGHPTGR